MTSNTKMANIYLFIFVGFFVLKQEFKNTLVRHVMARRFKYKSIDSRMIKVKVMKNN